MKHILFAIFTILFFALVIHLNTCIEQKSEAEVVLNDTICPVDTTYVDSVRKIYLSNLKSKK